MTEENTIDLDAQLADARREIEILKAEIIRLRKKLNPSHVEQSVDISEAIDNHKLSKILNGMKF